MVTFEVAPVEPGTHRLETIGAGSALAALLNVPGLALEACAPLPALSRGCWWNPFITAVDLAFRHHLPLKLSPDAVWLCIAQGFAAHVSAHAEALRPRLVKHEGRLLLDVSADELAKGGPDNDWPRQFARFSDALAAHLGKTRELLVADFTTTTPTAKVASEIVLMDAMSAFFEYKMTGLCGTPRVTLAGGSADWRSIRRRAAALSEFDCAWWVDALCPVLDQLVAASEGRADVAFWRSLYNFDGMSGGPYMTGWLNTLFPYVWNGASRRFDEKNALVWSWNRPAPPADSDDADDWQEGQKQKVCPMGVSRVPFTWEILAPSARYPMELLAGFFGVSQDLETLEVQPELGWAVRERRDG